MSTFSIYSCVVCSKPVSLKKAVTDSSGKVAHLTCLESLITAMPQYIAISPISVFAENGNLRQLAGRMSI
jgi:hypothetical protein